MTARGRYFILALSRIVTAVGAVLGVALIARAPTLGPKLLGLAITVMALVVMAIVPRHFAQRWRSPRP